MLFVVSNDDLELLFERFNGDICMDVKFVWFFVVGDDSDDDGDDENNVFERIDETVGDESLNDERRLSLKDVDDDDSGDESWFNEDFLSYKELLLSNVVLL